jgi:hypothetical protein
MATGRDLEKNRWDVPCIVIAEVRCKVHTVIGYALGASF